MTIGYRDFVPVQMRGRGFFTAAVYEPLRRTVGAANRWIADTGVEVVNVETVVLPNLRSSSEDGSEDPEIRQIGEMNTYWSQFVRVWYRPPAVVGSPARPTTVTAPPPPPVEAGGIAAGLAAADVGEIVLVQPDGSFTTRDGRTWAASDDGPIVPSDPLAAPLADPHAAPLADPATPSDDAAITAAPSDDPTATDHSAASTASAPPPPPPPPAPGPVDPFAALYPPDHPSTFGFGTTPPDESPPRS